MDLDYLEDKVDTKDSQIRKAVVPLFEAMLSKMVDEVKPKEKAKPKSKAKRKADTSIDKSSLVTRDED